MYELELYVRDIYTYHELLRDSLSWYRNQEQSEQLCFLNRSFNKSYTITQFKDAIYQAEWILNEERSREYAIRDTRQAC